MKLLVLFVALAALTLVVFAIWPGVDLAISHRFYDGGGFIGHERLARFGRDFFRVTPFVVLALYAALWLAKRKGVRLASAPSGKTVVFLIATMAIGPGLVVNLGLKDHWHRPRPYQTQEFGGPDPFRPWYEDNGLCKKNCSFVSGEAATGFWMAAPASVLPPPWRAPAMAAAFAFAIGASLLRMAFGGHYLSDVLLGGLVTLIVIELARRAIWQHGAEERAKIRGLDAAQDNKASETSPKGVSAATPNGFATDLQSGLRPSDRPPFCAHAVGPSVAASPPTDAPAELRAPVRPATHLLRGWSARR